MQIRHKQAEKNKLESQFLQFTAPKLSLSENKKYKKIVSRDKISKTSLMS
jgi:hypothetical protein